jgi:hypothetical protein
MVPLPASIERLVALDHRGHLLALVRVDQEHDFVMTHGRFLVDIGRTGCRPKPSATVITARSGKSSREREPQSMADSRTCAQILRAGAAGTTCAGHPETQAERGRVGVEVAADAGAGGFGG